MLMNAADYRESLRAYKPRVFVEGRLIDSVADEPLLAPGVAGVGVTYDFAHVEAHRQLMTAVQGSSGKTINRMVHVATVRPICLPSSRRCVLSARRLAARSAISRMTR